MATFTGAPVDEENKLYEKHARNYFHRREGTTRRSVAHTHDREKKSRRSENLNGQCKYLAFCEFEDREQRGEKTRKEKDKTKFEVCTEGWLHKKDRQI